MTAVALIPARGGSQRIPGKNVRLLNGHPLLAYTICATRSSGVFDRVVVSTDSPKIAAIAVHYGAEVPILRPARLSGPHSPDIEWVLHALAMLLDRDSDPEVIAILRPTSPLRAPETIVRAVNELRADAAADSIRAVERCRQHPGKMWTLDGTQLHPLLDDGGVDPPWHSRPYQDLPAVYVQNASLEVVRTSAVVKTRTISGRTILPFFMPDYEGLDLNDLEDWWVLERLLREDLVTLPFVDRGPPEDAK